MIFVIPDKESKEIFFSYLWKLAGVVMAGNGIEHVSQGVGSLRGH